MKAPILQAVDKAGGQAALARVLTGIIGKPLKQQNVWNWIVRGVPAEMAIPIEKATGGVVTRHQLRPDIYPIEDVA